MNEFLQLILGLAFVAFCLFAYVAPAAWAVGDAQKRGATGCSIVVLFCLFGPLSAFVWLLARPSTTIADRPPVDYTNPDDALAAASRLDQLGEWEAAITLYENAARQWPDQRAYIDSCLKSIKEKQALS